MSSTQGKKPSIGFWQADCPWPSLHVMVTDNQRFHEKRKTYATVEEAVQAFRKWLEGKVQ